MAILTSLIHFELIEYGHAYRFLTSSAIAGKNMSSVVRQAFSIFANIMLSRIPIFIDRNFRRFDYFLNNAYHPTRRHWALNGHGPSILIIMAYTVFASLYGPTWDAIMAYFPSLYDTEVMPFTWKNGFMFGFLIVLLCAMLLFVLLYHTGQFVRLFHILLIAAVSLFILTFANKQATEADNTIYYHGFFVFGIILLLYAWLAKPFAIMLLRPFIRENAEQIQQALITTELFEIPKKPQFVASKVFYAALAAITHYPLHLLLLPSLLILFLKDVGSSGSYLLIGSALLLAFMLSFWGSLHSRWDNMFQLITRVSMRGGMLIVSIAIIILAIARLLDIGYVTTVMDGTPLTLIPYFTAFYFYFLAYEYWANRSFNEVLMPIFGKSSDYGRLKYTLATGSKGKDILVDTEHRYLQFHGIDRFLVTGTVETEKIEDKENVRYAYETYTRECLFSRLLEQDIGQRDDEQLRIKAIAIIRRLRRLTHIYFSTLNILLIFAVVTFFCLANYNQAQSAVWSADLRKPHTLNYSLADSLYQRSLSREPAILLAASGGGTRAALYTSSVLYGLHKLDEDKNVLLGSGVSGGGVSLAYFAYHREKLLESTTSGKNENDFMCSKSYAKDYYPFGKTHQDQQWKCYFETISRPFIKDVIQGIAEWRIAGSISNGTLLAESLARNFGGNNSTAETKNNTTFGNLQDFGLILNTALVAHPHDYSDELSALYLDQTINMNDFYTIHGGSRLIFTNIGETSQFPTTSNLRQQVRNLDAEDVVFKYEIIADHSMPLTVAGALNANFPPVFSNSLVIKMEKNNDLISDNAAKIDKQTAFYVTDGGAVENRGILSLLYSLKSSLSAFAQNHQGICLPDIHIVVAEASASSIDYNNNRGLETALGGSLPIANQLYQELLKDARQQYSDINKQCNKEDLQREPVLKLHYLSMPRFFRTRGGMGTHWMMPSSVKFSNPNQPNPILAMYNSQKINRAQLEGLIASLYAQPERCESIIKRDEQTDKPGICKWLRQSKSQQVWNELKQLLKSAKPVNKK